jgi:DNA invertase Pin-like site-specific DNA recombinase
MKTAAIYVRVSTADQHVESQLYDLRELAATKGLRGCTRIRRSWCLWKEGTSSGA